MKRLLHLAAGATALALGLACLSAPGPDVRAENAASGHVRVGLIRSLFRDMPEPVMQVVMQPFKSLLEQQTGVTGQLVASGDADQLGQQLQDQKVHLGVFHGVEFAWARVKHPELKPLLIAVNRDRILRAYLVVHRDGKAESPFDLAGQSIAMPARSREHCRLFFERRCVRPGTTPEKFYREVTAPDYTDDALDDVIDGKIQAAVVDALALESFRKLKPLRATRLRVLVESEPFPSAVVAYRPGVLSRTLLSRFRTGLIAARNTKRGKQLLELCRITRFENIPEDYDELLTTIARAYPPPAH